MIGASASGSSSRAAPRLPRRVYLGADLGVVPGSAGASIHGVRAGGPASLSGLRPGDRIVRVGELEVTHPADLARALRGARDGESISVEVERSGERVAADVVVRSLPVESIEGGRVVLGEVTTAGARLRTVFTHPAGPGPWPCVFHLQGIDVGSCEHPLEPDAPLLRLLSEWTRAGFATLRVERSGVGDSEGPPPEETDLEVELEGLTAALDGLSAIPEVDRGQVFLFGHSIGGMLAPVIAGRSTVRGVTVFGTSAKRWRATAVGTTERQLALKGFPAEALSERLAAWAEMHAAVCRDGYTPAEAMARRPHLSVLASRQCGGAALFGHHATFFRQLDALGVGAAWTSVSAPVLVLRGEHDWVCDARDAESVVAHVSGAAFAELPGIGHDLRWHESLEASFHRPREGTWTGAVSAATTDWMRKHIPSRR